MTICVRLFARARELAEADCVSVELPSNARVADLRARLVARCPVLRSLLERSAIAVNEAFAKDDALIPADAQVAVLPPVSGG
jgi:molybdopterin converting factor small subunit